MIILKASNIKCEPICPAPPVTSKFINYSRRSKSLNPFSLIIFSFSASSRSLTIISFTNSLNEIFGFQPNFSLALLGSPIKESTSLGLKYFSSILINSLPELRSIPTSFKPLPFQDRLIPRSSALFSINSLQIISDDYAKIFETAAKH